MASSFSELDMNERGPPMIGGGALYAINTPASVSEGSQRCEEVQVGRPGMKALSQDNWVDKFTFRKQFKKTQLCRFFLTSRCMKGGSCEFAHGKEELHAPPDLRQTSICKAWLQGVCPESAQTCRFAHGTAMLRRTAGFDIKNSIEELEIVFEKLSATTMPSLDNIDFTKDAQVMAVLQMQRKQMDEQLHIMQLQIEAKEQLGIMIAQQQRRVDMLRAQKMQQSKQRQQRGIFREELGQQSSLEMQDSSSYALQIGEILQF
eukprot:gb/GFBE01014620.1/.p1 GENE.gb/GFBE01014620.1/~~gb/GFBE01014620.1/.p1  ORF type:complete len:261 (+),score=67.86 gb/GFBE01014620.1/:1-783(+)